MKIAEMETVDEVDPTFVTQFLTGGMTFTTKKIMRGWLTPELAEQLLKAQPPQPDDAAQLGHHAGRQMSAGRWQENGETIIVGKSGNLLDGQHRLQAVIRSGVSIMAIIVFGVDDDEAMVMASIQPVTDPHGHRHPQAVRTPGLAHHQGNASKTCCAASPRATTCARPGPSRPSSSSTTSGTPEP